MTQVTVKELAQEVEAPVERLLQQMREAGLPHTDAGQVVTDNEKQTLLTHLKSSHKSKYTQYAIHYPFRNKSGNSERFNPG